MSNQPDIGLILNEWEELIECARNEYVFDEPLDAELFRRCIKRSYEYFLSKGEATTSFDILEVELYARIYAYSIIPAVTLGENTAVFAASTGVAVALADMIVNGILRTVCPGLVTVHEDLFIIPDFHIDLTGCFLDSAFRYSRFNMQFTGREFLFTGFRNMSAFGRRR